MRLQDFEAGQTVYTADDNSNWENVYGKVISVDLHNKVVSIEWDDIKKPVNHTDGELVNIHLVKPL